MDQKIVEDAYDFAKKVMTQFPNSISSIALFGSVVRSEKFGDIDILIILDDLNNPLNDAFIEEYRTEIQKIANQYEKYHITTIRLTKFWNSILKSDPVMINIVRESMILLDTKVLSMFKRLLFKGELKPTPEAIANQLNKAKIGLDKVRNRAITNLIDIYWALIDALQSLIMYFGKIPPNPKQIPEVLYHLRKNIKDFPITKEEIEFYTEVYDLTKRVMHRQRRKVEHYIIEDIQNKTEEIIKKIEDLYLR